MNAQDGAYDSPSETVSASFSAPAAGIYDVCVSGADAAGNAGAETCTVLVVFDPDGGFVTGGGWIHSPSGAVKLPSQPEAVWDQGFEFNTDGWLDSTSGWYGIIARTPSGSAGVPSSSGDYHAIVLGDPNSAPFSRFDGYRDVWPGTWMAEIDVYLDPAWAAGTGFDYSVAASGSDGEHQRDDIFHVTKDTSTGNLLVAGSNNTNFAVREDLETLNHFVVGTAGWYTLQHVFRDEGGALAVDLNLLDAGGTVLFTETRYDPSDLIPGEVGGNRYAWFTVVNVVDGIHVDNHQLLLPADPVGKANFGFVSKYKKNSAVPEGKLLFQFKEADIRLFSDGYDWMVISSPVAIFQGYGTINKSGNYGFIVTAVDEKYDPLLSADQFRIYIWDKDTGDVVYDNVMGAPIGAVPVQDLEGGKIALHKVSPTDGVDGVVIVGQPPAEILNLLDPDFSQSTMLPLLTR